MYCGAVGWIDGDDDARRARGRDPHVHDRRRRAPTSVSAAASSPTRSADAEWAETELKAARLLAAASGAAARSRRIRRDRLDQRRAGAARRRARSRRSTTAWSSATACSRRCASTTACRSRGRATSRVCTRRRTALGLDVPDSDELRAAADAVLAANGLRDARLRITVTGGPAPPGSRRATGPPTVVRVAFQLDPAAPTADVVIVPWTRNERGAARRAEDDLLRGERARARVRRGTRRAARRSSPTPRATCARRPARTCSSCTTGRCCTPPPSAGCLLGVTRQLLLEIASIGIRCEERDVPIDALGRGRRGIPLVDDARGATDRARRRRRAARRARPGHRAASPPRSPTLVARDLDP